MVSNKTNKKAKKPIELTLGKAPTKPKEKDNDPSHLRKPIETSVCGMKQVLSLLETATNEVKNFVMYECDIMYECKICRSIFRSLANFILHKRNYCREKINPLDYINNNNDTYQENVYMPEKNDSSEGDSKSLNSVIEKLHDLERIKKIAMNVLTEDYSAESSIPKLRGMDDIEKRSSNLKEIILEKIDTNSSGVFQTIINNNSSSDCTVIDLTGDDSTKLEVMEIHKIVENDVPVLDPEGKICGFTSNQLHQPSIFPKSKFRCIECNQRFASQKSLTNHIKCVHSPSRIVYLCPTCKDTFANPWCVYRHLLKVHRMTNKQVRRMREQVHNSWIQRGEESSIQKKKPAEISQGEEDSENQWINDIEGDNDFQMCAGCGKHFERKAALHSHSQMCAKRLEICNNIKENAKKKGVEEAVGKAKSEKTVNEKPLLTGASKRKGQSIWTYQRKPVNMSDMNKQTINNEETDTSNIHNTDVAVTDGNGILHAIPDLLTPRPSPAKNDNTSSLSPIIKKIPLRKQPIHEELQINYVTPKLETPKDIKIENTIQDHQNLEHSKIAESIRIKECMSPILQNSSSAAVTESTQMVQEVLTATEEAPNSNNTISVDTSLIKIEKSEEGCNDVNSNESDQNTHLITEMKSEPVSLEECSRSSSSLSLRSTKSVCSPKLPKSPLEESSRPRSDSFVTRNAASCSKLLNKFLKDNSLSQTHSFIKCEVSESNTKLEKSALIQNEEEDVKSQSNTLTKSRNVFSGRTAGNAICLVSDNTSKQDDYTMLQNNHDLLSSDVTFEMFCKKVVKGGKLTEKNKKLEVHKISPRVLRKRRRLTVEKSSKSNTVVPKYHINDDDDDVIFVGETLDGNKSFNGSALENGFAGFSSEETKVPYSVDFSNLSYNNPLKCKQKEDPNDSLVDSFEHEDNIPHKKPMKRKARGQSVDTKTMSKHEKNELSFILRAAPYMNQTKLVCIPCGLTFKSFNLLLWHMSAHFSWFRFQCSKCSFITFNKYDCMLHARKQHKLKENNAVNFILPLPNWKTVLMSHEFRLLKDCNDLKGKHTDEKIVIDENHDQYIEDSHEILESDAILFGESSRSSEENIVIEKENVRKRNRFGKAVIDIQETIKDFQRLPEPVELGMPADVSEVIRTVSFDESALPTDEAVIPFDTFGDESNDDWGLPKESENGEPIQSNVSSSPTKDSDTKNIEKNENAVKVRPSRIRTKAKQNDDFVYYDTDINNVLKSTESFKGSPQKHRTDSVLSKGTGKCVPTTQKKKI